jgi:predicted kinase
VRAVAATVARFHARAGTGERIDQKGTVETIRKNWDECFTQTAETPADLWPPEQRLLLRAYVDDFLTREASRLGARIAEGRIRDCHGDLQAQHICCIEPIQIFDCIEFNERFRFGDTAGEIAFLAMDLQRLGASELAVEFINAYVEETGDYGVVPLLDFYRAYRALVRAKVLAFHLFERPELVATVRALFALAGRFTEPRKPARLLITSGVMGSGKSTVARAVAARLGAVVIRTDAVRKRLGGVGIHERATTGFEEGLYTSDMSNRTYAKALRLAAEVLGAGWTVIVDGSFSKAAERAEARGVAQRLGLAHATLWCETADGAIAERLARRAAGSDDVSDGRPQLLPEHRARYEAPEGEPGVVRVDTFPEPPIERVLETLQDLLLSTAGASKGQVAAERWTQRKGHARIDVRETRDVRTHSRRSIVRSFGRGSVRLWTASCWRRAKFSRASWRCLPPRRGKTQSRWSTRVIIGWDSFGSGP